MTRRPVLVARALRERLGEIYDMEPREYLRFLRQVETDLLEEIRGVQKEVKKHGY